MPHGDSSQVRELRFNRDSWTGSFNMEVWGGAVYQNPFPRLTMADSTESNRAKNEKRKVA